MSLGLIRSASVTNINEWGGTSGVNTPAIARTSNRFNHVNKTFYILRYWDISAKWVTWHACDVFIGYPQVHKHTYPSHKHLFACRWHLVKHRFGPANPISLSKRSRSPLGVSPDLRLGIEPRVLGLNRGLGLALSDSQRFVSAFGAFGVCLAPLWSGHKSIKHQTENK